MSNNPKHGSKAKTQKSAFIKKFNEEEFKLSKLVKTVLSDLDHEELDPEYRSEVLTVLYYTKGSRILRKAKNSAADYDSNHVRKLQTKNFNQIREIWALLKNRLEQTFELTAFDKLVEKYLNNLCARIHKSKVNKVAKEDKQPKGIHRHKEARREKRTLQQIHVNEEIYSDSDDDDLFNPVNCPQLYEEITEEEAEGSKDTVFIVEDNAA